VVGRYQLLQKLDRGGFAVVFLARHRDLGRLVALKQLAPIGSGEELSMAQRFLREARLASNLAHPNLVTVFDYLEQAGTPYIAMEYVPGGSLRRYLGRLSLAQIGGVLEDVLEGLGAVVPLGIVHRDLKPENLLVTAAGRIKIADFGIAKATTDTLNLTAMSMAVGTPAYMAPEQATKGTMGPWTDLYALGCVAYELLTGNVPFAGRDPMAMMFCHVTEEVSPLVSVDATIDGELSAWVLRLLIKDIAQRPNDPAVPLSELQAIMVRLLGSDWRSGRALTGPGEATASPGPAIQMPQDAPQSPLMPGDLDVQVGADTPLSARQTDPRQGPDYDTYKPTVTPKALDSTAADQETATPTTPQPTPPVRPVYHGPGPPVDPHAPTSIPRQVRVADLKPPPIVTAPRPLASVSPRASLYWVWALFPWIGPVAWVHAAIVTKAASYLLPAVCYSIPFWLALPMLDANLDPPNWVRAMALIVWPVNLVHALVARRSVKTRRARLVPLAHESPPAGTHSGSGDTRGRDDANELIPIERFEVIVARMPATGMSANRSFKARFPSGWIDTTPTELRIEGKPALLVLRRSQTTGQTASRGVIRCFCHATASAKEFYAAAEQLAQLRARSLRAELVDPLRLVRVGGSPSYTFQVRGTIMLQASQAVPSAITEVHMFHNNEWFLVQLESDPQSHLSYQQVLATVLGTLTWN
jgi:serine/threonine protein kinase